MLFSFSCYGHENISALHRNTIEFTKDGELTVHGDCIIGVRADFNYKKLKDFIDKNKSKKIKGEISIENLKDSFSFLLNPDFSDKGEIVIRKTDYKSERTLGTRANKSAKDIKRELINRIKNSNVEIKVIFKQQNSTYLR